MATLMTLGVAAQNGSITPEELQRSFRQTVQKRDISQRHLTSGIPLGEAPVNKGTSAKALPDGRVWFPGEWEEVKAIVVSPYYNYLVPGHESSYYWMAEPLVTGIAEYYKYNAINGWEGQQGFGPYTSSMDTNSVYGKVLFYLMDGIQLGGAEVWVRVEQASDSNIVLRTLGRMGLRHDNVRFLVGPGNTIWCGDFGPMCFYYGDQDELGMLDFTYYPGRALDDSLPSLIHTQMSIPNYITQVEWEGGNCLLDGAGAVVSSDVVYSANRDGFGQLTWDGVDTTSLVYSSDLRLTPAQVRQALHEMIGQRATHILPAFQYDGGPGHIDYYVDAYDENGFVITGMPDHYSNWTDYATIQNNIDSLCSFKSLFGRDYTMGTIPFPSTDVGNYFSSEENYNDNYARTYSNHLFVNNVILQPCFSTVGSDGMPTAAWDRANIEEMKRVYAGYTFYCVDMREFDGSGTSIHAIAKQIPADNPVRILHKNIHGTVGSISLTSLPVSAVITNRSGISHAELVYRIGGGQWQTANLTGNGNRWYGSMNIGGMGGGMQQTCEYYISATSGNGKTVTKPITAGQGGYYSFILDGNEVCDPTLLVAETNPMPMQDITFVMGTDWIAEDTSTTHDPDPVGIEAVELDGHFGQFYPNPANNQAHIVIDLEDGHSYNVTIIDQAGRTIHTSTLQSAGHVEYTIQTSRLATGVYNVVFRDKEGYVVRKMLVK